MVLVARIITTYWRHAGRQTCLTFISTAKIPDRECTAAASGRPGLAEAAQAENLINSGRQLNLWTAFQGFLELELTVKSPELTCIMKANGGIMRTVNNGIMQGTRVGAGPAGEPFDRGYTVAKVVALYHCANGHKTTVPFIWTATLPLQWECRVCSQPAGTDPLNPPLPVATYVGENTHLGRVKSRRTSAEGDALMAESLALRDHPARSSVPARPRRRKA